jgi:anti-sigma B factor antagonist
MKNMSTSVQPFEITVKEREGCQVFHLFGRLMDQVHADQLMTTLDDVVAQGHNKVILNLHDLQYMNSTGLNILISVLTKTRNAGGDTYICRMSSSVKTLFIVTKLDQVFSIFPSETDAVEKMSSLN